MLAFWAGSLVGWLLLDVVGALVVEAAVEAVVVAVVRPHF